ncbi:MAG: hypothetical protein J4G09_07830 [Proteobacteria bacterium]|nr:hypothetical protein [Pseudomonadota bacterium]
MSDRDNLSSGQRSGRRRNRRRSGNGQRRSRSSSAKYRRKVEEKLFGKKGDRARLRMVERLREAHGTPGLQRVFREYVRGYGLPADFDLLTLLLDLGDEQDIVTVLGGIEELRESISPEEKSLLRKRLRNLEMATEFDEVADATVDLLERL